MYTALQRSGRRFDFDLALALASGNHGGEARFKPERFRWTEVAEAGGFHQSGIQPLRNRSSGKIRNQLRRGQASSPLGQRERCAQFPPNVLCGPSKSSVPVGYGISATEFLHGTAFSCTRISRNTLCNVDETFAKTRYNTCVSALRIPPVTRLLLSCRVRFPALMNDPFLQRCNFRVGIHKS